VDNQHQHIKGYRDLSEAEIALMNKVKAIAEDVGHLVDEMADLPGADGRWVAIGKTDLQKGFMALVRSIARPTTF
jgi:hypothetical protein